MRFRYTVAGAELWADLVHHQIVVTGKNAAEAITKAKAAMKDYQRHKREGEFDDEWYND